MYEGLKEAKEERKFSRAIPRTPLRNNRWYLVDNNTKSVTDAKKNTWLTLPDPIDLQYTKTRD